MSEIPDKDPFNFDDLEPVEVLIKIKGKRYLLREASADCGAKMRHAQMQAAKFSDDGKVISIGNLSDGAITAVALSLFEVDGESLVPVGEAFVRALPARVFDALWDKLREISPTLVPGKRPDDPKGRRDGTETS